MKFYADRDVKPSRDGLNVYNARAFTAPFKSLPGLAFELEYAHEQNGDLLKSDAWTAQAGYEMGKVAWKPRLSYRYAYFEGDDPATPTNEAFDSLLPGFYDWGTWWQGEIAGEYFVSNSNLVSHQVRLHLTPSESVSGGLMAFALQARQAARGRAPGDLEGHRVRARRLLRLEAQQGLHRELPRRLRGPPEVRRAGVRPDEELRVRDDLPRVLLLSHVPEPDRRRKAMIERTTRPLARRVLIVDDELGQSTTAGGRSVRALAEELRARGIEVVEALSCEDGQATVVSDCRHSLRLRQLDSGAQRQPVPRPGHRPAARAALAQREGPGLPDGRPQFAGTVTVEVATMADEFVWILDDTASFVAGRAVAAIDRYVQGLLPPFTAALARYDRDREYSWAAPGHQGGVAFLKSPIGRVFFDFYGENLFRTDMGIERAALGRSSATPVPSARASAGTQGGHGRHVVADEEHGPPRPATLAHLAEALLLERRVADREHLVDEQDLRLEMRGDRERQAHVHAARVALHRGVEERLDLGERDDLVELAARSPRDACRGSRR